MAKKPQLKDMTATSVEILNAIRNSATTDYRDYVPVATNSIDSIKAIGAVIMDNPTLQNQFINALVNRIGRVIITSKLYSNPWAIFKKGYMEYGETIEEIFVNLAEPFEYDAEIAETNIFKREIPDVRSAFHVLNYQKFYKVTVQEKDLKQAFLTWDGVSDLIGRIIESMTTGANYDEFLTMKYLLARQILSGFMTPVEIPEVSEANMKSIVASVKATSNKLTFLNSDHNIAGVYNHAPKDEQYVLINANFDAIMDVEVLASAFNMDKAEFFGHRILVDGFGNLDNARLAKLFAEDKNYVELTSAELSALDAIPCVLVDGDFFQIYDNMQEMTENYNGEGLYWNYWLHQWKTFSVSPFAQRAIFVPLAPSVESVTIAPTSASLTIGQTLQINAVVETTGFATQAVTYTSSDDTIAKVHASGLVTAIGAGTATITATSVFDDTKTATAEVTVTA